MTGTGVAIGATECGTLRVEVRSVNGRGLQVKLRLCPEVSGLEAALDELVRGELTRGSVTLAIDRVGGGALGIDRQALQQLVVDLRHIAAELGLAAELSLRDVLAIAGATKTASLTRELAPQLKALVHEALADLRRHRLADGAAAVAAMEVDLAAVERLRGEAAQRAPALVDEHRERLLQRVREFVAAQGVQIAAADVVREVAMFAERADVGEELQRLGAHLGEVRALLRRGGPLGRKLEFLLQEVLREANTLGSKSPDVTMAHCVVEMKASIDRLKEQAANLE